MDDDVPPSDDRPVVSLDTRGRPHGASTVLDPPRPEPVKPWSATRGRVRRTVTVVAAVAAIAALAAWSLRFRTTADGLAREGPPVLGHVHDLTRDPVTGKLMAGAHSGLFAVEAKARSVGLRRDVMGLSSGRGGLYASGHPGPGPAAPSPHVGLLRSDDGGRSWVTIGLAGQADLHALSVEDQEMLAADTVTGTVLASPDGRTWTQRSTSQLDRLVATADGTLVGSSQGILTRSIDHGATWQVADGPEATGLAVDGSTVWALAVNGLWQSRDQARSWERVGPGPAGEPTALYAEANGLYAASLDKARAAVWRRDGDAWKLLHEDPPPVHLEP